MVWEINPYLAVAVYAVIVVVGVAVFLKLAKDRTKKVSNLRLIIQVAALVAIFLGLIIGPYNAPGSTYYPLGITPRDSLLGGNLLGNQMPDGLTMPFLACYYPNGRTVTCAIWQLQAYIFPFWNSNMNGYGAYYVTTGLEKLAIVVASLVIASIILGRFYCGWLCPFGLYMDILTRIRKAVKRRHFSLSEKSNTMLGQSRYLIIAFFLIFSVILGSFAIFGTELIPGTITGGPAGTEAGIVAYINEPFCLACPMRPLCIAAQAGVGALNYSYISQIVYGPFWVAGQYLTSVNIAILIAVTILGLAYRRFFCRICPLGAISGFFSTFTPFKQLALTKLNKNQQKCTKCGVCKRVCPTQATDVFDKKGGDVTESRCILCARCVEICPYEDALNIKFAGKEFMHSRNWLQQGNVKNPADLSD
jgi:ferredoxin-type protein NapH